VAACVAAASVVAKVTRDRLMRDLHTRYPVYGFARHKGYSTRSHMRALTAHGPCPEHRRSFANVGGGRDPADLEAPGPMDLGAAGPMDDLEAAGPADLEAPGPMDLEAAGPADLEAPGPVDLGAPDPMDPEAGDPTCLEN
jgi:ribonuclease HII